MCEAALGERTGGVGPVMLTAPSQSLRMGQRFAVKGNPDLEEACRVRGLCLLLYLTPRPARSAADGVNEYSRRCWKALLLRDAEAEWDEMRVKGALVASENRLPP